LLSGFFSCCLDVGAGVARHFFKCDRYRAHRLCLAYYCSGGCRETKNTYDC
jgi:hypothetical protein